MSLIQCYIIVDNLFESLHTVSGTVLFKCMANSRSHWQMPMWKQCRFSGILSLFLLHMNRDCECIDRCNQSRYFWCKTLCLPQCSRWSMNRRMTVANEWRIKSETNQFSLIPKLRLCRCLYEGNMILFIPCTDTLTRLSPHSFYYLSLSYWWWIDLCFL